MSSFNLGCPIAGLCFLFAVRLQRSLLYFLLSTVSDMQTLFVLGYEKQAEILPRCTFLVIESKFKKRF